MSLQAMRQALEFVEKLRVPQNVLQVMLQIQDGERVITALRIAIEQAEKAEPAANDLPSWMRSIDAVACKTKRSFDDIPLYTHPAPVPAGWLRVVDEAMVCSHFGVVDVFDSYEVVKKKFNDLICWNTVVERDLK